MKSLLASVRAAGGLDRVDHAVQLLEDEWRKHGEVPLERLWVEQQRSLESDADEPIILLAELIRTDLRCRFARGQTPTVDGYLGRFPELKSADSRVLSLIYEEFCLREERGEPVDVESFCDRYPRWKESLVSQLQYHHLFSQAAGVRPKAPQFPEPGDTFEEFQLVSLLGKGGTSRVFLAKDLSLGGKQVVLKVSMDRGREPQAQGALDHPHIVPVNSVVFDDREMRGLSMPYRPGLPLDEVIRRVEPASRPPRAMALWEALVRAPEGTHQESPTPGIPRPVEVRTSGPRGDGWEGFPVRGSYAQGVAWIVKVVAHALHYAHGERTYHRDVKPANVLLTLQHGPQLLDFNLAESPHSASQAQAAMHGGTLPYMAPEQIEAFLNPELWGKVGAQADIYSLGLVLRELLTGQAPDLPAETLSPPRAMRVLLDRRPLLDVSVRRTNPSIPHALEAIVAKCLTVAPEHRYPDAGALVDDLNRFLQRGPLAHARNPSYREKTANWGVRNRLRMAVASACLLPVAFLLGLAVRPNATVLPAVPIQSSPALKDALKLLEEKRPGEAINPLKTLVALYPKSSLPRLCLCFAYDACKNNKEAAGRFQEVLRTPDHTQELRAWSKDYPGLVVRLEKLAHSLSNWGSQIKNNREGLGEGDRQQVSKGPFDLSNKATNLARELKGAADPGDSDKPRIAAEINKPPDPSDFDIAVSEEGLGEYEAVYARASRALESIQSQRAAFSTSINLESMVGVERTRFSWCWLRARVAMRLADRLRNDGPEAALEKALKYMTEADRDLQICRRFVNTFTKAPRETHWVEGIRAPAMLTLGEIEIDLGRLAAAEGHLKSAKHAINTYKALSQQLERNDPSSLNLLNENLELWDGRLNEAVARLNRMKAEKSPRKPSTRVPDESVASAPAKG